eukprot:2331872-Rhodomonas_salina.2
MAVRGAGSGSTACGREGPAEANRSRRGRGRGREGGERGSAESSRGGGGAQVTCLLSPYASCLCLGSDPALSAYG